MAPNTEERSTESHPESPSENVSKSDSGNNSESLSESLSESRVTSPSGRVLRSNSKRKSSSGVSGKPPGKQRKHRKSAQEAQEEGGGREEGQVVEDICPSSQPQQQLSDREVLLRIEKRAEELGLASCKMATAERSHFLRVHQLLEEVGKLFVAKKKLQNELRGEQSKREKFCDIVENSSSWLEKNFRQWSEIDK